MVESHEDRGATIHVLLARSGIRRDHLELFRRTRVCVDTLRFLFVPPLREPHLQPRSYSGIDRRDAVFPNRNIELGNNWSHLYRELDARLVLFEFKNYDATEIGKEEVNQTLNYLSKPMGR